MIDMANKKAPLHSLKSTPKRVVVSTHSRKTIDSLELRIAASQVKISRAIFGIQIKKLNTKLDRNLIE